MRVSVLIPTFRRPEGFLRAARSVFAQNELAGVDLVAIDNSPEASARDAFAELAAEAPIPFHHAHEPAPGVANARNAALKRARGDLVAWLDDDEEASPHWLATLVKQRTDTGAQSVFGPVRAKAPGPLHGFYEQLYSRSGPAESGLTPHAYGIGNSLQPRSLFGDAPFDARANQTGGEDDALFASWREAGATFAWAADAWVIEHVAPERARLTHGLRRAFAYGQGPCETAWALRDYPALARHTLVGAGQLAVFGAASLVCAPAAPSHALSFADRAARGAGKVFWMFEQRFYGEAAA